MAKKTSFSSMYAVIGIFVAIILIGGAYTLGVQRNASTSVLGTNTSTNTSTTKAAAVASSAILKCTQNGGFITTQRRGNWGFYQVCNFADDMNCELYALYEGQCPVGGVHTIGYSTSGQVFCALRGGQPTGTNNGKCKLPDGVTCTTDQVYRDTCSN